MITALAIIGDFNPNNRSHNATNDAIEQCSRALNQHVDYRWVATEEAASRGADRPAGFGAFWIAPASPYQSMEGALMAIRTAREKKIPLLGTCGGFQHIILEYARNVIGIADAQHEESAPGATNLVISRLSCSLVGRTMSIQLEPDSLVARAYGRTTVQEQYHCNFGVNPDYIQRLRAGGLRMVGSDDEGVARAVELPGHPFFVGTLFLPQLSSSPSSPHPLILAFLRAG